MRLITFDPLRSIGLDGARYIKPALLEQHLDEIARADWLVFPDYADVVLLVHGLHKRIFPSLATYQLGFDKVEMTRAFRACSPAHVPQTLILPNTMAGQAEVLEHWFYPFVGKLPRSSQGQGVFLIENAAQWADYCGQSPTLYVQERLTIDRDLRVVWLGDRIVDAYWRLALHGEFHNNLARGGVLLREAVPDAALALVEHLARTLDIDHAGFDIAMQDGHPYVFEFNRLFGLQGLNDIGLQPGRLIGEHLAGLRFRDPQRLADHQAS